MSNCTLALVLAAGMLATACTTTRTDTQPQLDAWRARVESAVPVGTSMTSATAWFGKQGLVLQPEPKSHMRKGRDMEAHLGAMAAKESACDTWMLKVTIKVSPDDKVSGYDFYALGGCL